MFCLLSDQSGWAAIRRPCDESPSAQLCPSSRLRTGSAIPLGKCKRPGRDFSRLFDAVYRDFAELQA